MTFCSLSENVANAQPPLKLFSIITTRPYLEILGVDTPGFKLSL